MRLVSHGGTRCCHKKGQYATQPVRHPAGSVCMERCKSRPPMACRRADMPHADFKTCQLPRDCLSKLARSGPLSLCKQARNLSPKPSASSHCISEKTCKLPSLVASANIRGMFQVEACGLECSDPRHACTCCIRTTVVGAPNEGDIVYMD